MERNCEASVDETTADTTGFRGRLAKDAEGAPKPSNVGLGKRLESEQSGTAPCLGAEGERSMGIGEDGPSRSKLRTGSGEKERRFFIWGLGEESRDRRGEIVPKNRLLKAVTVGAAE